MDPQPTDLKAIRVLYFAMLAGQVIFAFIVTMLIESGILPSHGKDTFTLVMQVAIIVIAAGAIPASFLLFRKRLADINPEEDLGKKIEKYRAALIIRMALCEFTVLFAVIAYFITTNRSFLWMIILLIGNFLLIYPSRDKLIQQLQLNSNEQSLLGLN
jgi:hypothetical protein